MAPAQQAIADFRETVWDYYARHGRDMPWRQRPSPYNVLVSELMLQQTQVSRVIPKFLEFTQRFPDANALAAASLQDVLQVWNGLGYNRRAKFLWQAAQAIIKSFGGQVPGNLPDLVRLPGIGPNTAGAVLVYAFNRPAVFVETNIRTVYFHHFFADDIKVADGELLPLIEVTLDTEHPREWYWALMDYGSHLKHTVDGNLSKSRHYVRQSTFAGSRRQLRGRILRELLPGPLKEDELLARCDDSRTLQVLQELQQEHLIETADGQYKIATGRP